MKRWIEKKQRASGQRKDARGMSDVCISMTHLRTLRDAGNRDAPASFACIEDVHLYAVCKYGAVRCKRHIFWFASAYVTHDAQYLEFKIADAIGLAPSFRSPTDLHPSNASNYNAPLFSDATFDRKDISHFRNSEDVIRNVCKNRI